MKHIKSSVVFQNELWKIKYTEILIGNIWYSIKYIWLKMAGIKRSCTEIYHNWRRRQAKIFYSTQGICYIWPRCIMGNMLTFTVWFNHFLLLPQHFGWSIIPDLWGECVPITFALFDLLSVGGADSKFCMLSSIPVRFYFVHFALRKRMNQSL